MKEVAAAFEALLKEEGLLSNIEGVEVVVEPSEVLIENTIVVKAKSSRQLSADEEVTVGEALLDVADIFTHEDIDYDVDVDSCIVKESTG